MTAGTRIPSRLLPLALAIAAAACESSAGVSGAPRPCSLMMQDEVEAVTMGPLEPLEEEVDECKTNSPAEVDALKTVYVTLKVHAFETRRGSTAFYESVAAQTEGMTIAGAAEKSRCSLGPRFAGGRSADAFGLVGTLVLQVDVNHPEATCDMPMAILDKAVGRL